MIRGIRDARGGSREMVITELTKLQKLLAEFQNYVIAQQLGDEELDRSIANVNEWIEEAVERKGKG